MLITVHDHDGDCFHINVDHVSMVTQCKHPEVIDGDEITLVPTPDRYMVFVLGIDVPIILPEKAMGQVVEAMAKAGNTPAVFGRN